MAADAVQWDGGIGMFDGDQFSPAMAMLAAPPQTTVKRALPTEWRYRGDDIGELAEPGAARIDVDVPVDGNSRAVADPSTDATSIHPARWCGSPHPLTGPTNPRSF